MSTVIKGGTVVTADMNFPADVLIEGEKIVAISKDLKGGRVIDAAGCYVPGGIGDPLYEMPFMGDRLRGLLLGRRASPAAPPWWSTSSCRPERSLVDALGTWHQKAGKAAGILLPHGDHLVGRRSGRRWRRW